MERSHPREYAQFRGFLGSSSGFQSYQYRGVEFLLGNKNRGMLRVFESEPEAHALLGKLLEEPTLYDAFLRSLRAPATTFRPTFLTGTRASRGRSAKTLSPSSRRSTNRTTPRGGLYEACEDLVDIEDNFQAWRFRHLRTVQRTIGFKVGTGGSSGVDFLKRALDLTFFPPELYAVRTEIGN